MGERLPLDESGLTSASTPDPAAPHLVLWNTDAFHALRPGQPVDRVQVDHHLDGRLVGSFVAGIDQDAAVCGFGAPFGGVDLARSSETVAGVEGVVDEGLVAFRAAGCRSVEVRCRPPHYGANEEVVTFVLLNRGFVVDACEINAHMDLRSVTTVQEYLDGLKPAARKMYRRSSALGLVSSQIAPHDEPGWAEAYEVLRRNRVDRGRPMRLGLDYVRAIRDAFPGRIRLLVTEIEGSVCAAALVYRVAAGHDLVQYWGDALHELPSSPMNVLVAAVVEHALASGAANLDIGISSEDGRPNHGLIQFKRSIGCQLESRLVLSSRMGGGS